MNDVLVFVISFCLTAIVLELFEIIRILNRKL